jgi:PAS domain-containing protein
VLAGAVFGTSAWLAAGVAGVGLVAAGAATAHLHNLDRELRQALRARAEWERRHSRLYDGVAVGVFCADPQGRVIRANRGLCTLLA